MIKQQQRWMCAVVGWAAGCVCVWSGVALGQATVDPLAQAGEAGRPAPAAERVGPVLDAWWQEAVFYQVFVRSFADSTGDGIGDFRGMIERLDYLNDGDPETDDDLGITGIWLMPIMPATSYHKYDTTDYMGVHPDHGTMEDFRAFLAACEARGIRVIIDLVLNHCSIEHPWFQAALDPESEYREWFIWRDEDPGWRGPWGQPVWHPSPAGDGTYYYGLFWRGMPDLNFEHKPVTEAMFEVIRFWLEDVGVAGFRLDAIRHLIEDGRVQENTPQTHAWLRRYFEWTKEINPEAFSVGEVWSNSDAVSRYVGDQMDTAFEFDLSYRLVDVLREQRKGRLVRQLRLMDRLYPLGMYATFLRNHDQPRVLHELGGDRAAAALAAAIQFCLPGVPFIYYGEEIGMSATKPDRQLRTPMQWSNGANAGFSTTTPWLAPKPDFDRINVAVKTNDPDSMLSHYRRLIRLRQAEPALRIGTLELEETGHPGVLAFVRRHEGRALLCVFNLTDGVVERAELAWDQEWEPVRELLRGTEFPLERLEARGAWVLELPED